MPTNHAAWLVDNKSRPLEVREAPYAPPGAHEIVVKNGAVGINPIDYGKQLSGDKLFNWIKYPFILGLDLAGEVVEVGKDVTNVEPGDRVLGMAAGMDKRVNRSCEGAFQEYTIVRDYVVSPIPDDLPLHRRAPCPLELLPPRGFWYLRLPQRQRSQGRSRLPTN